MCNAADIMGPNTRSPRMQVLAEHHIIQQRHPASLAYICISGLDILDNWDVSSTKSSHYIMLGRAGCVTCFGQVLTRPPCATIGP